MKIDSAMPVDPTSPYAERRLERRARSKERAKSRERIRNRQEAAYGKTNLVSMKEPICELHREGGSRYDWEFAFNVLASTVHFSILKLRKTSLFSLNSRNSLLSGTVVDSNRVVSLFYM